MLKRVRVSNYSQNKSTNYTWTTLVRVNNTCYFSTETVCYIICEFFQIVIYQSCRPVATWICVQVYKKSNINHIIIKMIETSKRWVWNRSSSRCHGCYICSIWLEPPEAFQRLDQTLYSSLPHQGFCVHARLEKYFTAHQSNAKTEWVLVLLVVLTYRQQFTSCCVTWLLTPS